MFIFSRLMCEMTLTADHLIAIGRGDFWPTMAGDDSLPPRPECYGLAGTVKARISS